MKLATTTTASLVGAAAILLQDYTANASPLLYEGAMAFLSNAIDIPSASAPSSSAAPSVTGIPPTAHNNNNHGFTGHTQVYRNCVAPNTFAITFDDGPQENQPAFVELLNNANAKGTFFVNGMNYRCIYDPDMVQELRNTYDAGHQIANHGWGHDHSSQLTDDQFDDQVAWVEEALVKILGVVPNHFRPPYGDYNDANLAVLTARNYSAAVLWDQVSGPGTGTSVDDSSAMYRRVAATFPQNHIVLNHEQDTAAITQIIPNAIRELQDAGYRLVTTAECLGVPAYQWVGEPEERDDSWTCAGKPGPGQPGRHKH